MYAYLLSSLPTLRLTETPKLSIGAFLASCESLVSAAEQADLAAVFSSAEASNTAVAACWLAWETQWHNAVAQQRAARRRLEPSPYLRMHSGYRVEIALRVTEAYTKETPLARELALDELRWRLLEELTLEDSWGFAALYAYAVKLRLAWRWADLTDEVGWVALEAAVKQLEASHG